MAGGGRATRIRLGVAMPTNLVWMDLEMTGLDPETDVIIEMATVITDSDLNILAEGPVLAVWQPQAKLDAMDEWNQTHHGESGLIDRVRASAVSEREAEARTLAFIEGHVERKQVLTRYMPTLEGYLHYRNIDVSSLKELVARWRPELLKGINKANRHTALSDIRESIEELRYYRKHFIALS
jgi:oligoribonuclease